MLLGLLCRRRKCGNSSWTLRRHLTASTDLRRHWRPYFPPSFATTNLLPLCGTRQVAEEILVNFFEKFVHCCERWEPDEVHSPLACESALCS